MKENLEELEQFAIDVILNRRKGFKAGALRVFLSGMSVLYRNIVGLRLSLYRNRVIRERNLGCLVISIGNLTVGGTGKTPVVEKFARALTAGGRRVAILSRGYKSVKPPLKERLRQSGQRRQRDTTSCTTPPRVVTDGKRGVPRFQDRGRRALHAGDQPGERRHRGGQRPREGRLARDREIRRRHPVARRRPAVPPPQAPARHRPGGQSTQPFGNERLLPARHFAGAAEKHPKRASYIFITKCDGSSNEELNQAHPEVQPHGGDHRVRPRAEVSRERGDRRAAAAGDAGGEVHRDHLRDRRAGEFRGPRLRKLGAKIELTRRYTDHHRYTQREIDEFIDRCVNRDVDMIVTTEKDWVRFPSW